MDSDGLTVNFKGLLRLVILLEAQAFKSSLKEGEHVVDMVGELCKTDF